MGPSVQGPKDWEGGALRPPAVSPAARMRLAVTLTMVVGLVASLRLLPIELPFPLNILEAGALWVLLPAWPALAWALVRRHWRLALALACVGLIHLGWAFDFVPRRLDVVRLGGRSVARFTLVSANLLAPRPSRALARSLRDQHTDVLVVTELSDEWLPVLEEEGTLVGLDRGYLEPHASSVDYFGMGIATRFAVLDHERIDIGEPLVRVDLDIGGERVRVWAAHTFPPSSAGGVARWRSQMRALEERLSADRDAHVRTVVAGDLNTTPQTAAFRSLLSATGLVAAHDLAGNPFACTWPMRGWNVPPLFRLDHVLVRGLVVDDVREGAAVSSDHAPLVVRLALPAESDETWR